LTDSEIINLFWERSESAISETAQQYGLYCFTIAMNILRNKEDSDECVSDTYMNVWNSIPPQRPTLFSAFIGRITRNLSLNMYKARKTQKRSIDETALLLSELDDCIPAIRTVEDEIEVNLLEEAIDSFLSGIKQEERLLFMRRYWYADSISDISKRFLISESKVKTKLFRTRNNLKYYLKKKGIIT